MKAKTSTIFFLFMTFCVTEVFSQEDSIKTKNYTYLYIAPVPLSNSYVGRSWRYGIVQDVGRKFAIFGEASHFISIQKYYTDLKGKRYEIGARYYLDAINSASEWVSIGVGFLDQNFTREGNLFQGLDSASTPMLAQLTRKSEFINFGIGFNKKFARFLYFEMGVQVGFRHRDVDVQGMTESEDNDFRVDTRTDWETAAMQTTNMYVPDLAFILKFGCSFSLWETKKRV